jgi:hypothetical protein
MGRGNIKIDKSMTKTVVDGKVITLYQLFWLETDTILYSLYCLLSIVMIVAISYI